MLFKSCGVSLVPCPVRPLRQENLLPASLYFCQFMISLLSYTILDGFNALYLSLFRAGGLLALA
jgi:hypothetical protein